MANDAAFPQRWMFEDEWAGLCPMTLRAAFVEPGHGESARWFENIAAVWIVALHAIHPSFREGMMVRGLKFAPNFQMALQARSWIFAGIDDEFGPPTGGDVFAAGAVARFAPGVTLLAQTGEMNAGMRTGREALDDGRVAIHASLVAHFVRARNDQWRVNGPVRGGTGIEQQSHRNRAECYDQRYQPSHVCHFCGYGFGCRMIR
jgi:hypothetical protein